VTLKKEDKERFVKELKINEELIKRIKVRKEEKVKVERQVRSSKGYLKTSNKTNDFVFLGRLVSDKGADMCIDLLNQLNHNNYKSYTLTIIGDGPEMENLKNKTIDLKLNNQIVFLGFLQPHAIQSELSKHKYLLVPSRWEEPFGIVVLEGMGCGCIPIVSDGGGLPDAVGNAGIIFKRNSIKDLFDKTSNLLDDINLQKLIYDNIPIHLEKHNIDNVSQLYFDLILNIYNINYKHKYYSKI
jgi:glycosyltransferase involved in cell wall biosynthesis